MSPRRKRIVLYLSIGAVLILVAISYVQFFLARPIGSGPAGPPVNRSAFARPWTDRSIRVVGLGDSVTAGFGADTPEHAFFRRLIANSDESDPAMVEVCLSKVLPNLEFENLAVSGSTSADCLESLRDRLEPSEPGVFGLVILTTGGNDLIHSYGRNPPKECAMYGASVAQATPWIDAFRTRLETILDTIDSRFPGGCEVFLGDIYDPTDGVGDAPSVYLPQWPDGLAIHARYNAVITEVASARPNVHVVPLHRTFLGHGSHCRQFWRPTYRREDPHYWYFDNIEDPNDRGHDAIRRVFLNSILEDSSLVPVR